MSVSTGARLEEFYPPAYQRLVGACLASAFVSHLSVLIRPHS
ncbi:hypothetical protein BH24ACT15_BH24ACT15_33450 [soil metagenome]